MRATVEVPKKDTVIGVDQGSRQGAEIEQNDG